MCFFGFVCCIQCSGKQTSQLNFSKNRWYQSEILEVKFEASPIETIHNLKFKMSYVHGFQFAEIPLELYITSPNHQISNIPFTLYLLDENHNEIGDCVGDYCDIEYIVKSNYKFSQSGNYKIQVMHKFDYEYLPNILSASVELE